MIGHQDDTEYMAGPERMEGPVEIPSDAEGEAAPDVVVRFQIFWILLILIWYLVMDLVCPICAFLS